MKKTVLIFWVAIQLGALISCNAPTEKKVEKVEVQAINDLPNMTITFLDGSQIHSKKLEGNTIIILFFPDCDHCQREATQIQKNLERFKDYTLYFLTEGDREMIKLFASDFKLNDKPNVKFGLIKVSDVLTNFGSISAPSLYIYSSEHKLIQSFNGETDIEAVLKFIQ